MGWDDEARIRCRFAFICPQLWKQLEPTAQASVRHCFQCNRDVYLAVTESELKRHSKDGHCIAVPLAREDDQFDPDETIWMVGRMDTPYGEETDAEEATR